MLPNNLKQKIKIKNNTPTINPRRVSDDSQAICYPGVHKDTDKGRNFTNEIIDTNRAQTDCTLQSLGFNSVSVNEWMRENIPDMPKELPEGDWVVKLIEDLTTFFIMINSAYSDGSYSKPKIVFACTTFAKLRTTGSLMNGVVLKKLLEFHETVFSEPQVQGFEEHIGSMRDLLSKFDSIKDSAIFKKFYKLMMYAMSLSVFDKIGLSFDTMGYTHFEAEALKKKFNMGPDFIHTLLDTFLFLCERGFQILKTGNLEYIFHSGSAYSEYYDQYVILKRQSTLLTNPEAHGFKESTFRANLESAIEKGSSIIKHSNKMSHADKRLFMNMHSDLQYIQCDLCTKRAAREHRKAPFSVLIFGESGIGKSTIKDMLFNQYAKLKNLENDSSFCYTRNPVANFWDGFTTSQWALVLDDVASIKPTAAPTGDPSMLELIQIINSVPFVPDQADLSNKGRTPLKCEFVMATTNVKTMNVQHYFSHPSAVQRRLPFIITPTVKPEYAKNDGSLDSSKTTIYEGIYPDYWDWTVDEVLIRKTTDPQKLAATHQLLRTNNIIDFLKWFNRAVKTFDDNQNIVEKSVQAMKTIQLCTGCYLPTPQCECEIQSIAGFCKFSARYIIWCTFFYTLQFFYILYYSTLEEIILFFFGNTILYSMFCTGIMRAVGPNMARYFVRSRCEAAGRRIQAMIGYPRALIAVVTLLTSGTIIYKMCKYLYMTQGAVESVLDVGHMPVATDDEPENIWYKNDFVLSSFDTTPQINSSKSLSRDTFIGIIGNNCVNASILYEGKIYTGRLTCIKGQKYICNNHIFPVLKQLTRMHIVQHTSANGVNRNVDIGVTESQFQRDLKNDICIITIPNLPPRKDISQYFAKGEIEIKTNGFYISRNNTGELIENNLTCIKPDGWTGQKFTPGFEGRVWSATSKAPTINGECGSLLVGETVRGYIIMGIHVLKSNYTHCVGATNVNQDIIHQLVTEDMYTLQASEPRISSASVKRTLTDLHKKSPVRYMEEGTAAVYGSFVGFRPTHKSAVEISPMANVLSPYGYKIKYGKPDMKTFRPWRIAALDMVNPVVNYQQDILDHCEDSFFAEILEGLVDVSDLHVYDTFTAINGAKGVAYVDKLNRNTSAGNPWKKGKKHFLFAIPEQHELMHPVDITDEIRDNMETIIEGYHRRERQYPNYCAHLKDEAVSFKKVASGKTRVFVGAPMDWSLVVRKYLLSVVRKIQLNQEVFESAPGIVAQSPQWTRLYKYITKFGEDRVIAGDYRAFDKTMPPAFILAAFKIIKRLCAASGNYTENDLSVIDGIAQDVAFPMVDYNGDMIEFYGTNPSGHPLTVIINGLVNALYMRYVYVVLNPKHTCQDYKNFVALMTYGDDNIMSASKEVEWYNHTAISEVFAHMGITYTMADKEAKSIPFINISEASFLKRTWIFNEELGYHLAPLEAESIEKSLMVWTRSKSIGKEEQMVAIIGTAVREYFFYGREEFEFRRDLFIKVVEELDLKEWVQESTFPTWSQLVDDYLSGASTKRA
jgi:hypothetical protein